MPERITFRGVPATTGACQGCGLVMIVTDKDAFGAYSTYHQDPMCQWYLNRCTEAEPTGPTFANNENVVFLDKK